MMLKTYGGSLLMRWNSTFSTSQSLANVNPILSYLPFVGK